jgi:hypothetical protein
MLYHPDDHRLGRRDVIGAWVVCLCAALILLGLPIIVGGSSEAVLLNADARLGSLVCRLDPPRSPVAALSLVLSDVHRAARG